MALASQQSAGAVCRWQTSIAEQAVQTQPQQYQRSEIHVEYETILVQSVTGN
jgi:hypothetical protein